MENFKELEEMTVTKAFLVTLQELADSCETLEEFKKKLAEIISKA